jgi:hypothetical protein
MPESEQLTACVMFQIEKCVTLIRDYCSDKGVPSVVDHPGNVLRSIAFFCTATSVAMPHLAERIDPKSIIRGALDRIKSDAPGDRIEATGAGSGARMLQRLGMKWTPQRSTATESIPVLPRELRMSQEEVIGSILIDYDEFVEYWGALADHNPETALTLMDDRFAEKCTGKIPDSLFSALLFGSSMWFQQCLES